MCQDTTSLLGVKLLLFELIAHDTFARNLNHPACCSTIISRYRKGTLIWLVPSYAPQILVDGKKGNMELMHTSEAHPTALARRLDEVQTLITVQTAEACSRGPCAYLSCQGGFKVGELISA